MPPLTKGKSGLLKKTMSKGAEGSDAFRMLKDLLEMNMTRICDVFHSWDTNGARKARLA